MKFHLASALAFIAITASYSVVHGDTDPKNAVSACCEKSPGNCQTDSNGNAILGKGQSPADAASDLKNKIGTCSGTVTCSDDVREDSYSCSAN